MVKQNTEMLNLYTISTYYTYNRLRTNIHRIFKAKDEENEMTHGCIKISKNILVIIQLL